MVTFILCSAELKIIGRIEFYGWWLHWYGAHWLKTENGWQLAHLCELVMSDVAPGRWTVVSQAFTETNDPLQNIRNRWLHLHGTAKMWNNTLLSSEGMDHPALLQQIIRYALRRSVQIQP